MPYNNNPIAPSAEITGTVNLPLARAKKILHADPDLPNVNANAAFAMTVAAEHFLQYLVEQTHNVARAERKPRRNIQYRDVANAVARHDNLEFLTDVVPRTTTYKAHAEKVARQKKEARESLGGGVIAAGSGSGHAEGSSTNGHTEVEANGAKTPIREPGADHAGPEVMDIDAVTSPTPSAPNGTLRGGQV